MLISPQIANSFWNSSFVWVDNKGLNYGTKLLCHVAREHQLMSMIMRKLNHNYCFCDIFKSHAWYISQTLDKTPITQSKKFADLYIYFPRWRFSSFKTPNLFGQNGCILASFFCSANLVNIQPSWPNVLLFATIISVILSITLIGHPPLLRLSPLLWIKPEF